MLSESETYILDAILSHIPYYGEFDVSSKIDEYLKRDDRDSHVWAANTAHPNASSKIHGFLLENGHAIKRNDIKEPAHSYIELTKRGRWLRQMGSLGRYNTYQNQKKAKLKEASSYKKEFENLQYRLGLLQESDSIFQKKNLTRSLWINFWIAIGTSFGAIYVVFQMIEFYEKHWFSQLHFFYFVIGLVAGVLLLLAINQIRNPKKK